MIWKCWIIFYLASFFYMCNGQDFEIKEYDLTEDLTDDEANEKKWDGGVDESEVNKIKGNKEDYLKEDMIHVEYRATVFDSSVNTAIPESSYPENELVDIDTGSFTMGMNDSPFPGDGEGPERHVTLRPFSIDKFEVSNGEFAEFVSSTKYRTEAELFGNSFVMDFFLSKEVNEGIDQAVHGANWWVPVSGANWKRPEGKGSNIDNKWSHPVVHVSWNDAVAFCRWKGKRLPTEAEWEYACRGGMERKLFPWGDDFLKDKSYHANIWQGRFPKHNSAEDGYNGTCEVDKFVQNKYQLHNMVGNVWEWVSDWFTTIHPSKPMKNPRGPPSGTDKLKKGGSFMCHKNYCYRYRCSARSSNSADTSAYNLGFRCAKSKKATVTPSEQVKGKDEL